MLFEFRPAVGIGDPGMLEMLKYDAMTALFEKSMQRLRNRAIQNLGACWRCSVMENRTENLPKMLDKIYRQITSFPPERFLRKREWFRMIDTAEDLNHAQAMPISCIKAAAAAACRAWYDLRGAGWTESVPGADRIRYREAAGNRAGGQLCCDEGGNRENGLTLRKKFTGDKELP